MASGGGKSKTSPQRRKGAEGRKGRRGRGLCGRGPARRHCRPLGKCLCRSLVPLGVLGVLGVLVVCLCGRRTANNPIAPHAALLQGRAARLLHADVPTAPSRRMRRSYNTVRMVPCRSGGHAAMPFLAAKMASGGGRSKSSPQRRKGAKGRKGRRGRGVCGSFPLPGGMLSRECLCRALVPLGVLGGLVVCLCGRRTADDGQPHRAACGAPTRPCRPGFACRRSNGPIAPHAALLQDRTVGHL